MRTVWPPECFGDIYVKIMWCGAWEVWAASKSEGKSLTHNGVDIRTSRVVLEITLLI